MDYLLYVLCILFIICILYSDWYLFFKFIYDKLKSRRNKQKGKQEDEALLAQYHQDIENCDIFKFRKITKDFTESHPLKLTPSQVYEKIRLNKY